MSETINKILTFSYDDGVTQDRRLIELLDKYGMKCTFNLNSGLGGHGGACLRDGQTYAHVRYTMPEIAQIYAGHEVAAHAVTHPFLNKLTDEEIVREVEDDRKALSDLVGYEVVGFAYPYGTGAMDERVETLLRERTGVRYARATAPSYNFEPQTDLLNFAPTIHHTEWDKLFELGQAFVDLTTDRPQIFYVWGHAYEFDKDYSWAKFEAFLQLMANRPDIRYCTNREALLGL